MTLWAIDITVKEESAFTINTDEIQPRAESFVTQNRIPIVTQIRTSLTAQEPNLKISGFEEDRFRDFPGSKAQDFLSPRA